MRFAPRAFVLAAAPTIPLAAVAITAVTPARRPPLPPRQQLTTAPVEVIVLVLMLGMLVIVNLATDRIGP
ncbi:MAG: hypothetical protein ACRDSL_24515 [Pseudonocardiaceae bacterium]